MYKFIGTVYQNGVMVSQLLGDKVVCEQFLLNDALPKFEEYLRQEGYVIHYVD